MDFLYFYGMPTIAEFRRRFQSVNLRQEIPSIIESTKQELADLNRDQLRYGYDKNGERLKSYSSLTYAIDKNQRNPLAGVGNPDLRDTGKFYNGWKIDVSQTDITFDSTDSKTPDLESKYGQTIFGLTTESKSTYVTNILYDLIKRYIQDKTKVSFV